MRLLAFAACTVMLSGCADGANRWTKPGQSASATRGDLATCERDAETATLADRGQSRSSYNPSGGARGLPGEGRDDPLAMHDRSEAATDYRKAVARCMTAAGYARTAR
ncbi:MAG: hypothetical protein SFV21_20715 [Rhodospirillaceae bacterium]|nr:hypothetical protein [Rhodospirillaceae bacterium]